MNKIITLVVFILLAAALVNAYLPKAPETELPTSNSIVERASPHDWIKEDQILVYDDRIILNLKNAEWATFTDTNSMDPVIDKGANAIEIVPESTNDIHIGDIVSYESEYVTGTVIHRVIDINQDELGWYATLKGDNSKKIDPERVRFEKIKRIVVAVIY
ncbi:MAG: hypothetical protein GY861_27075 [bacterium]|nr:hypothetical protein [bacterium]